MLGIELLAVEDSPPPIHFIAIGVVIFLGVAAMREAKKNFSKLKSSDDKQKPIAGKDARDAMAYGIVYFILGVLFIVGGACVLVALLNWAGFERAIVPLVIASAVFWYFFLRRKNGGVFQRSERDVGEKSDDVSATANCRGCHATIPADASVCPKCGRGLF